MKRNAPLLGFAIGMILPAIGSLIVYFLLFRNQMAFTAFWHIFRSDYSNSSKVISLSVLLNIAPFMYCTNKRYDYTARGIFSATILYLTAFLLYKFVL